MVSSGLDRGSLESGDIEPFIENLKDEALPVMKEYGKIHNFCLKCFQKWVRQGKHQCANCHAAISKIASQPRINSALVAAIRTAKSAKPRTAEPDILKAYHDMLNDSKKYRCAGHIMSS